jgi:hypothetical protein
VNKAFREENINLTGQNFDEISCVADQQSSKLIDQRAKRATCHHGCSGNPSFELLKMMAEMTGFEPVMGF